MQDPKRGIATRFISGLQQIGGSSQMVGASFSPVDSELRSALGRIFDPEHNEAFGKYLADVRALNSKIAPIVLMAATTIGAVTAVSSSSVLIFPMGFMGAYIAAELCITPLNRLYNTCRSHSFADLIYNARAQLPGVFRPSSLISIGSLALCSTVPLLVSVYDFLNNVCPQACKTYLSSGKPRASGEPAQIVEGHTDRTAPDSKDEEHTDEESLAPSRGVARSRRLMPGGGPTVWIMKCGMSVARATELGFI